MRLRKGHLIGTQALDQGSHVITAQAGEPDARVETSEAVLRHLSAGDFTCSCSRSVSLLETPAEVESE